MYSWREEGASGTSVFPCKIQLLRMSELSDNWHATTSWILVICHLNSLILIRHNSVFPTFLSWFKPKQAPVQVIIIFFS